MKNIPHIKVTWNTLDEFLRKVTRERSHQNLQSTKGLLQNIRSRVIALQIITCSGRWFITSTWPILKPSWVGCKTANSRVSHKLLLQKLVGITCQYIIAWYEWMNVFAIPSNFLFCNCRTSCKWNSKCGQSLCTWLCGRIELGNADRFREVLTGYNPLFPEGWRYSDHQQLWGKVWQQQKYLPEQVLPWNDGALGK